MTAPRTVAPAAILALALAVLPAATESAAFCAEPTATTPATAAVLNVDLRGTSDSKGELRRLVREGAGEHLKLLPQDRVDAALRGEKDPSCRTADCAARMAAATGARYLVHATVGSEGSDYELEVLLTDTAAGRARPALRDRCLLCGWAEVGLRLRALASAASVAAITPSASGPDLATNPDGNGTPPPRPVDHSPVSGLTVGKWLAAAAAVGLLATAGVMFGVDGRGTCDLPPEAAGLKCPRHYDTAVEGGVFLAAGLVAAGASGTLFYLDYKRTRVATIAPAAVAGPHGFTLGVGGSF